MKTHRRALLTLAVILCIAQAGSVIAQPPDGQAIWDKTVQLYANAKTYSANGSISVDMGFFDMSGRASWLFERPNSFMMTHTIHSGMGDMGRRMVICNGEDLYERMEITHEYTRKPAPPDLATFQAAEDAATGFGLVSVDQLLSGVDLSEKIEQVAYVRSGRYRGMPVHVLELKLAATGEWPGAGVERVWIGQEDSLIYRVSMDVDAQAMADGMRASMEEMSAADEEEGDDAEPSEDGGEPGIDFDAMVDAMIQAFAEMEMGVTERYRDIRIGDQLPAGSFNFHPRPGEKRVRVLSEPETDESAMEQDMPDINVDAPDFGTPEPSALLGTEAPDFTLVDLEGNEVTLSELRGSPVLIDFWASWCGPCQMELPHVQKLYEEYADKGLQVLGISGDADKQDAADAAKELGLTFTVLWQNMENEADMAIDTAYNVTAIPRLVLVDADGIIAADVIGYHEKKALVEMLKEVGL